MCLWDVMWSPLKQTPGALKWLPFWVPGLEQSTQRSPGRGISSVIKTTPDPNDFPVCKLNIKRKSTGSNRKGQIYQRGLPVMEVLQIPAVEKKKTCWLTSSSSENGPDGTPKHPLLPEWRDHRIQDEAQGWGRRTAMVSCWMENLLDSVGFYGFFSS